MAAIPERVAVRYQEFKTNCTVWHFWNVVFGVGAIAASGFGSAFNFVESSNHIIWSSVSLIGTVCAGISAFLIPGVRSERNSKAVQHIAIPIIQFEQDLIPIEKLIEALREAEVIAMGGSPGPVDRSSG